MKSKLLTMLMATLFTLGVLVSAADAAFYTNDEYELQWLPSTYAATGEYTFVCDIKVATYNGVDYYAPSELFSDSYASVVFNNNGQAITMLAVDRDSPPTITAYSNGMHALRYYLNMEERDCFKIILPTTKDESVTVKVTANASSMASTYTLTKDSTVPLTDALFLSNFNIYGTSDSTTVYFASNYVPGGDTGGDDVEGEDPEGGIGEAVTVDMTETNTILMAMLFTMGIYVSAKLWKTLIGR